ncbi:hypothetical protein P2318_29065 [Myxococcaceae bacterium GXIMD 01537]
MAEMKVSQADIDKLAQKLEQQLSGLSDKEKALLHGVFALAGSAIEKARAGAKSQGGETTLSVSGNLAPLSAGFKEAFQPGSTATFGAQARGKPDHDGSAGLITWTRGNVAIGI